MPTDQQIAASKGIHPLTERFAKELYQQAGGVIDGVPIPFVAWEYATHDIREAVRSKARSWIERGLYAGLTLADYEVPRRGSLGWCYPFYGTETI